MIAPFNTRNSAFIGRAIAFCVASHCAVGQKRKYTGEDYYHHPLHVATLVDLYVPNATEEMLAAAVLHDVVEDTAVTIELVAKMFGSVVAAYVEQLTDVSKPEDGNRASRKAMDLIHTSRASPHAKTIKLADLISNTGSIVAHDPVFAVTYLEEKRKLLDVLTEGDPVLYQIARQLAYGSGK
jgi:(p)ppGpp synthase/HD superfamily hydrolase